MSDSILRLQSAAADVVIKTRPFAEIIYLGPHLSHFSPQDALSIARPVANGRLDVDSPVTLMAELGHGLFGAPGIEGHRQGLDASPMFTTTEVAQDGQNLTIISEDAQAGLRLCSEIQLDNSGVLSVRHGLTNLRPQPWQSRYRSPSAPAKSWPFMAAGSANSSPIVCSLSMTASCWKTVADALPMNIFRR